VVGLDEVNGVAEIEPEVNISEESIEEVFSLLLCLFEEREEEEKEEEDFVEFCIFVLFLFLFFTMIQVNFRLIIVLFFWTKL
jgi:hypothetical protein